MLGIRMTDLRSMGTVEREGVMKRLASDASALPNGQADGALARVRAFEARYEMSSDQLVERLGKKTQRETADVAEWLFCLKLLSISGR